MPRILCRPVCFNLKILHSSHVTCYMLQEKASPFSTSGCWIPLVASYEKLLKENLRYPVLMGLKASQNHACYIGFLSVLHRTHSPRDKKDRYIANPRRIFILKGHGDEISFSISVIINSLIPAASLLLHRTYDINSQCICSLLGNQYRLHWKNS
jgi:hypothetical protein